MRLITAQISIVPLFYRDGILRFLLHPDLSAITHHEIIFLFPYLSHLPQRRNRGSSLSTFADMKTLHRCLAACILLASCAQDSEQPTAHAVSRIAPPKPKPAPMPYPLETCLVTDDDLDEMDEHVSTVHRGQTFEFCCKPCLAKFKKHPEKYAAIFSSKQ